METAIKFYEAKLAAAKEIRSSYETVWADIMDHLAPDLKGYLTVKRKDGGPDPEKEPGPQFFR